MPQIVESIFTCNFEECDSRTAIQVLFRDITPTEVPVNWTLVQGGVNGVKRFYCSLHTVVVEGQDVMDSTSPMQVPNIETQAKADITFGVDAAFKVLEERLALIENDIEALFRERFRVEAAGRWPGHSHVKVGD